jgi:hypothetical protein
MASTPANRAAFIKNVLSQLQSYGFDGIDIVRVSFYLSLSLSIDNLSEMTGVGASNPTSSRLLIPLVNVEYPGTERGGANNDGQNFLSLLKEFETAIDKAVRPVIISITAPASYWWISFIFPFQSRHLMPCRQQVSAAISHCRDGKARRLDQPHDLCMFFILSSVPVLMHPFRFIRTFMVPGTSSSILESFLTPPFPKSTPQSTCSLKPVFR